MVNWQPYDERSLALQTCQMRARIDFPVRVGSDYSRTRFVIRYGTKSALPLRNEIPYRP